MFETTNSRTHGLMHFAETTVVPTNKRYFTVSQLVRIQLRRGVLDTTLNHQHYMIKSASDLRQVGGFPRELRFTLPIKLKYC
jgi:hypothetical protein